MHFSAMNFRPNNQPTAPSPIFISPYKGNNKNDSFTNVKNIMIVASGCGKHPHKDLREKREPTSSPSIRHVLFPSRSPPPVTKKHSSMQEKAKISSLALVIDRFAAAKITPSNYTPTDEAASSPSKRSLRQTLHRRNKHVLVSSHSPAKPKSLSPSKARAVRKHHRCHNFALNATDFEILFKN